MNLRFQDNLLGVSLVQESPYLVFEFKRASDEAARSERWTLLCFDDQWTGAHAMFLGAGYPPDRSAIDTYVMNLLEVREQYINQLGIALMPYFAASLPEVGRLVVSSFVTEPEAQESFREKLKEWRKEGGVACTVDLGVDPGLQGEIGRDAAEKTYAMLRAGSVSPSRIAYLTTGGVMPLSGTDLERIVKLDLLETSGAALKSWWRRMRGDIDYTFFKEATAGENWHNAATILASLDDSGFAAVVERQANLDKYGVWRWVETVLNRHSVSGLEKSYTYLCGKSFLRKGGYSAEYPRFAYVALRGLLYGLFLGIGYYPEIEVTDIPKADLGDKDLNDDFIMQSVFVDHSDFLTLAKALRDWLEELHLQPSKTATPRSVVCRHAPQTQAATTIEVKFTAPLPDKMIDGSGLGQVTAAWQRVKGCFGERDAACPKFSSDRTAVTFTFERYSPPRPE